MGKKSREMIFFMINMGLETPVEHWLAGGTADGAKTPARYILLESHQNLSVLEVLKHPIRVVACTMFRCPARMDGIIQMK